MLTGLIVPVPPSKGPPKRASVLISDDHHVQPASFPRSSFISYSNLPLYSLLCYVSHPKPP